MDLLLNPKRVNIFGMLWSLLFFGIIMFIYFMTVGIVWYYYDFIWFFSGLVIGMIIHELIHGLGFMWIGKAKRSDVKFGIMWKYLAPYAHCKVPMKINAYRWAIMLPMIITGVIPLIIGFVLQDFVVVLTATLLTAGGIGDIYIYRSLRPYGKECWVADHPTSIGCILYKGQPSEQQIGLKQ